MDKTNVVHFFETPGITSQAAIPILIEVKTPTDLSSEGTSNCSNDPWSYDDIFAGKKSLLAPENTLLPFKNRPLIGTQ